MSRKQWLNNCTKRSWGTLHFLSFPFAPSSPSPPLLRSGPLEISMGLGAPYAPRSLHANAFWCILSSKIAPVASGNRFYRRPKNRYSCIGKKWWNGVLAQFKHCPGAMLEAFWNLYRSQNSFESESRIEEDIGKFAKGQSTKLPGNIETDRQ